MGPARALPRTFLLVALAATARLPAQQFGYTGNQFDLAPDVSIDEAPAEARKLREQAAALLQGERYDEAIDHLQRLINEYGERLTPLTDARFVGLAQDCQLLLLSLPGEARRQYQARVDDEARRLYERGRDPRDGRALRAIVERLLASSWGDDALWLLGERALEQGNFAAARAAWEMLVPNPPAGPEGVRVTRLAYPAPQYPLEEVLARLVLVSVLEGDAPRAARELAAYREQFPNATGRLAGRDVACADFLDKLLAESRGWPSVARPADWTTYAGDAARRGVYPHALDVGGVAWRVPITAAPAAARRRGELPYFPVVSGPRVFVADDSRVLAIDLASGAPAWGGSYEIYSDRSTSRVVHQRTGWGSPRYTLTLEGARLFARLGPPETTQAGEVYQRTATASIVCLDVAAEGRLDWKLTADEGWAFEGPPVCDAQRAYLLMRRSDVRPQAHVACYDLPSGRPLWRRFVCGAETPARGQYAETTHGLLALDGDRLYACTNLGAVAALDAADGRILWLYRYPRLTRGDLSGSLPHYEREPTPCLSDGGAVYAAPSDGQSVLALDAAGGQLLWELHEPARLRYLMGAIDGRLLAGGDQLWWIDAATGRVEHRWPDGGLPHGFGRGVIAGDQVLWPTRDDLFVFDARSMHPRRDVSFRIPGGDLTGGNLVPAAGRLLIATADELIALDAATIPPAKAGASTSATPR